MTVLWGLLAAAIIVTFLWLFASETGQAVGALVGVVLAVPGLGLLLLGATLEMATGWGEALALGGAGMFIAGLFFFLPAMWGLQASDSRD